MLAVCLAALAMQAAMASPESAREEVFAAERAFAKSMADRSLADCSRHVSEDAIFFGRAGPLRGKAAVVAAWSHFVVRDPQGKVVGRFNSIWRQAAPDVWRVIFDKGSPPEPRDKE